MSMIQSSGLPMRGAVRVRVIDGLAALLGVASSVSGIGAALTIPYGIALQIAEDRVRVQTRIYQLTSFDQALYLLIVIGLIAVPGVIGLGLAWRGGRSVERVSLAGMAARLSVLGLASDGLLLAAFLALLGYRWLMWG